MRTLGGGGEMACQLTVELPACLRSNGFKTFTRFRRRHRVHVYLCGAGLSHPALNKLIGGAGQVESSNSG